MEWWRSNANDVSWECGNRSNKKEAWDEIGVLQAWKTNAHDARKRGIRQRRKSAKGKTDTTGKAQDRVG